MRHFVLDRVDDQPPQLVLLACGPLDEHFLGRALVETGSLEPGIVELETAVTLAPDSPEMHFALARAYAKAGRKDDAARARATFAELDRKRDTSEARMRCAA